MIWSGNEYKITLKRGSRYIRMGAEYVPIDKTLTAFGIAAEQVAAWEANAANLHAQRRSNEAAHNEAEHYTGSKYD